MKKLLLIINNKTRTQNEKQTYKLVKHFSKNGYATTVYPIDEELDHLNLTTYLRSETYDLIVALGGDGTLNRTINTLLNENYHCPVGYIPAGTTNDFAKNLNLDDDVDRAMTIITTGKRVSFDIGRFNDRYFNYVACFGAFADVSYSTDQSFKNLFGYAAYALTAISNLSENLASKCHLRFEFDDEIMEDDYIFGALCNSLSIAGVKINTITEANLHDGKFELFLIKCPQNALEVTEILKSLINHDFNNPYCQLYRTDKIKILSNDNVYWTLDGEPGGNPTEIDFQLLPNAIDLMVKED